jgi:hypothetical protein
MADKITSTGSAIAALLIGAGVVMPSPTSSPVPDIPNEAPPIIKQDNDIELTPKIIKTDPTHVGLVRVEDGTKFVTLIRPVGEAETCTRTVCNALVGEQWVSKEGPNYVKQLDGSWKEYDRNARVAVQEVAMVSRPQCVNGVCTFAPRVTKTLQTVAYAVVPDIGQGGGQSGQLNGMVRTRTVQRANGWFLGKRIAARRGARVMGYGSAGS